MATHHAMIDTALGWAGLAWTDRGVCRVQIPGGDREAVRARLLKGLAGSTECEPDGFAAEAAGLLRAYCAGAIVDFSAVPLDLGSADPFRLAIWSAARRLGHGETTTYGGLAEAAGHKGMARETGEALGRNPVPIIVPCHRILAAGGKIGGFSAPGGSATKSRLLALENATSPNRNPAQASFAF
ncbi:MAG: methylated-DNA--[protein]-cysteine S-methyltransferase [Rhizobiaceae bacterium]|nr:methylated-DNA--[protein]-cysteine S-methyltransferase [Rhizobiaceae bacterium]MCV0405457.1 methylated-DNA--[protein]-cysteine S-methyltransferase [Rhizobiaceae bacterium]